MATIALIVIGVITLVGKLNKLTREVFWGLAAGREHLIFFSSKKVLNERWEVVPLPSPSLLPKRGHNVDEQNISI
jgi:hypothetical protein